MLEGTMTTATVDDSPQRVWMATGYWGLQACGWGFYFYAQASGEVIFADTTWQQAGTLWGVFCLCGIALTDGLRRIIRRRRWLSLPPRGLLVRMVIATLLLATTLDTLTVVLSSAEYHGTVAPIFGALYRRLSHRNQLINQFVSTLLITLLWVGLYLSFAVQRYRYHAQLRQTELATALQAAELRLLKAQLNPHFLFNALNGVRALIGDEPVRAQEAVTQLARTLRYTLASGEEELVTLSRELEMVNDYLALESLRHADRLQVVRDIAPEAPRVLVPVMLLQTLVDNAFKHGIAQLKQGGTLRIEARVLEGELLLRIVNPCPEKPAAPMFGEGMGLRNSAERLRLLFGERAGLRLDLSHPGIAIAEMRVPA
jgi:two-component system sensor histidine kinase AlgZ